MAEEQEQAAEELGLLDNIIQNGQMVKDESQVPYAKDLIGEFVAQILDEGMTVSADTAAMINEQIAKIDELCTLQMNEVLHHPDFQKLEGSWRGLNFLVMNTETGVMLKLRLLNVTAAELLKDLETAVEFDQSQLFKKVYEEEYGTFGGSPYTMLVGDFEFGRHPQDMALLEKLSNVAAAAHAPFIAAADPKMFDLGSFTQLGIPRDLAKVFESAELMWGNAAYALAQRITNAFALYKWCAAIRGVEGGGLVEGLPTHTFSTDEGDIALKCPTEIAITDRREKELSDLGFISLVHCKGTDYACFFGGQTTQKPKVYDTDSANANARISAVLPYVLAASRFAHYIKAIMRDKIGSFQTADNISAYLNGWIGNYVLGQDDASQEIKAQYPLREVRVDVTEIPGKPGCYNAIVFLRPHFQLEELTASIRLVAELPPPAG